MQKRFNISINRQCFKRRVDRFQIGFEERGGGVPGLPDTSRRETRSRTGKAGLAGPDWARAGRK